MLNRLTGGGSPGIEGCEGEGDTEGDGEREDASGRELRTIEGGPPGSGCDLDGEWVDRKGGRGGGGSFDLGSDKSRFLEELLCVGNLVSDRRAASWMSNSEVERDAAHLVSFPGTVELVCRRVLRLQSLRFDISKRWHRTRPFALSEVPGETKDASIISAQCRLVACRTRFRRSSGKSRVAHILPQAAWRPQPVPLLQYMSVMRTLQRLASIAQVH